ncbi:MAG: nucleotidyl transferase AbiEii/AbiGii toxin family protein [Spirochaetales bacterium]|nr:nucleotidyl transferase AbiEii/AbiGii toxin family protein [Spirochaetales bacterium]
MKTPFPDKITLNSLFLWFINRLSEELGNHAILKGGMALQLYDCPRSTNDLDYVFVPYKSKKELLPVFQKIVKDISENPELCEIVMTSKAIIIKISIAGITCQIEGNVALTCKSEPLSTKVLADRENQMSRIIKVMNPNVALSHKLAAWNERRLLRDVYDLYFLFSRIKALPDMEILHMRLNNIESRLPGLKKKKKMSLQDFIVELENELKHITSKRLQQELGPLLNEMELTGLERKINVAVTGIIEYLEVNKLLY